LAFVENILVRSNLSILDEDKYKDLPQFFAENNVEMVASLPCYLEENVTYQRGKGVYSKNIRVLQKLNRLGYGVEGLKLNLVYNPGGNFLPGPQPELESAYKENLRQHFGIEFNSLYTITNMPIGRFRSSLEKQGLLASYLKLLSDNFNSENLGKVMCRNLVNVDWQGRLYDCDFNHVLKLPVDLKDNYIGSVKLGDLVGRPIKCGSHCYTCVAGAGSSCQGSLKNRAV
jgi:radical SAM/Cys-rich protein